MASVLGIDFSLNGTGLFFIDENNQTKFILFSKDKKLSSLESCVILPNILIQEDKLDWVVEKIRDIIINEDISFICMEDHIGRYFNWMDGYGIIKKFIRDLKIPYVMGAPTIIKSYASDQGKADKSQMGYYLRKEYNLDYDYIGNCANNIVDAAWMAFLARDFKDIVFNKKKLDISDKRKLIIKKLNDKKHLWLPNGGDNV